MLLIKVFKKWLSNIVVKVVRDRVYNRSYKSLVGDLESSEIGKDPVGNGLSKSIKDSV
jgi:hypothetical protein